MLFAVSVVIPVEICSRCTMPRVAVAVVAALAFMSLVHSSLAGTTRANIKLVNNGYESILIAVAETVPVSESDSIIRRIKVGTRAVGNRY